MLGDSRRSLVTNRRGYACRSRRRTRHYMIFFWQWLRRVPDDHPICQRWTARVRSPQMARWMGKSSWVAGSWSSLAGWRWDGLSKGVHRFLCYSPAVLAAFCLRCQVGLVVLLPAKLPHCLWYWCRVSWKGAQSVLTATHPHILRHLSQIDCSFDQFFYLYILLGCIALLLIIQYRCDQDDFALDIF